MVKRVLRKRVYPPDKQENASETVLEQAELFAGTPRTEGRPDDKTLGRGPDESPLVTLLADPGACLNYVWDRFNTF